MTTKNIFGWVLALLATSVFTTICVLTYEPLAIGKNETSTPTSKNKADYLHTELIINVKEYNHYSGETLYKYMLSFEFVNRSIVSNVIGSIVEVSPEGKTVFLQDVDLDGSMNNIVAMSTNNIMIQGRFKATTATIETIEALGYRMEFKVSKIILKGGENITFN